jgi:hypothetical protein
MLVYELYRLYNLRELKKEKSVLKECRGFGDGIWDLLGYYDPSTYEVVICDSEIEDYANKLAGSFLEYDEVTTKLVLRELVRLHEHGHSLLHTGKLGPLRRFKKGYRNLLPVINEPVTEFIVWSTLKHFGTKFFEKVFEEVDKTTPSYYQRWRDIKQIIDNRNGSNLRYVYCIPSLIYVVRKETWKDFDGFLEEINREWETIFAIGLFEIL